MLKKEKPMMTVAAIIEQAQNRWMDQHPLQVYNRFQGSYCKYYFLMIFLFTLAAIFTVLHHRKCDLEKMFGKIGASWAVKLEVFVDS